MLGATKGFDAKALQKRRYGNRYVLLAMEAEPIHAENGWDEMKERVALLSKNNEDDARVFSVEYRGQVFTPRP